MKKIKAFTLIELLIVVAIIAILAAIAVPNFLEAQIRAKVSRARSDMRSIATALESYYVDNSQYPAWAGAGAYPGGAAKLILIIDDQKIPTGVVYDQRSFAIRPAGTEMGTLTTPTSYMSSYPVDSFSAVPGATFAYYTDPWNNGWVLYSPGPDDDSAIAGGSDLNMAVETVYVPFITQPSETLIVWYDDTNPGQGAFTYDPTNGTTSDGDLWRVKQ